MLVPLTSIEGSDHFRRGNRLLSTVRSVLDPSLVPTLNDDDGWTRIQSELCAESVATECYVCTFCQCLIAMGSLCTYVYGLP